MSEEDRAIKAALDRIESKLDRILGTTESMKKTGSATRLDGPRETAPVIEHGFIQVLPVVHQEAPVTTTCSYTRNTASR